jgi:hypothetical protein
MKKKRMAKMKRRTFGGSGRRSPEPITLHHANAVSRLARTTRWLIYVLVTILTMEFAWLKLIGHDLGLIMKDLTPTLLFRLSLALYFTSWAFGTASDTNAQESVYAVAPADGSLPVGAWIIAVLICVVFAILCFVKNVGTFSVFLTVFLIVNVVGWRYILAMVSDPLARSVERYTRSENYVKLQELRLVEHYLSGTWQWWRFAVGAIFIGAMLALAFQQVSLRVATQFGLPSADYAFSAVIFGFVAVMEGWIWAMRLRRHIAMEVIREIGSLYRLISATS